MIVAAGAVSSYNIDKKICHTGGDRAMPSYRKSAQVDMTHGSVLGRAALFALPICAGNILQLLYSTVDTLVIGNFCDTTALASVATSSQPLEILLCVFVGIGSGISILVSQAVGRADHDQLQKLVRTSVWLLFAASLPLTVIGFLLGPWMLRLMQVPADAMPGAVLYLRITMLGILGNMGYNFNAGLLRGIGNSSSSLLLLFISCAANIVLDLVLTGALGLGIGGVAAATAIALFLSWICSIFYIRRRCTELALPVLPCGFDAGALRQIVRIGLPLGLNSALYSIGHIFLQVLYNLQGSVFVAGCSVAGKEGRACWLLVNEGNTPIKTRLTLPVAAPLCRYDLWSGQPCACPAERPPRGPACRWSCPRAAACCCSPALRGKARPFPCRLPICRWPHQTLPLRTRTRPISPRPTAPHCRSQQRSCRPPRRC